MKILLAIIDCIAAFFPITTRNERNRYGTCSIPQTSRNDLLPTDGRQDNRGQGNSGSGSSGSVCNPSTGGSEGFETRRASDSSDAGEAIISDIAYRKFVCDEVWQRIERLIPWEFQEELGQLVITWNEEKNKWILRVETEPDAIWEFYRDDVDELLDILRERAVSIKQDVMRRCAE